MGSQAGSASVFVRKATDVLQAALALEGSGDGDGAFALYSDAIRDLTCAAAFEQRGSAFTEAQRGSIVVIQSRRAQLERRLQARTGVARRTPQQLGRAQVSLAPELTAPQGPTRPASDTSLDAPILGHEKIKSLLREAIILPQLCVISTIIISIIVISVDKPAVCPQSSKDCAARSERCFFTDRPAR